MTVAVGVPLTFHVLLPGEAFTSEGTLDVLLTFSVLSNLLVGATCALLAARPERRSATFTVVRLIALASISLTGLVSNTLLGGLGAGFVTALADHLVHVVVPLLAVIGWLAFGPRGVFAWRHLAWALVFPAGWAVVTLLRGASTGHYPYPFVDVGELGYARVLLHLAGLGLLFVGFAAVFVWFGKTRAPGRSPTRNRNAAPAREHRARRGPTRRTGPGRAGPGSP